MYTDNRHRKQNINDQIAIAMKYGLVESCETGELVPFDHIDSPLDQPTIDDLYQSDHRPAPPARSRRK